MMAVDSEHSDYSHWLPEWTKLRDVIAGQTQMRRNGRTYVRCKTGMKADEFTEYVNAAPFYEATSRTVDGLTGMAFATDPVVTLPESMQKFKEDMTLDGVALDGFSENLFDEVLVCNRAGVLVDFPPSDSEIRTRFDAELANRRPYAAIYTAEQIFNWSTGKVNGKRQLTEVRLKEYVSETDEKFDTVNEERIRVLKLLFDGLQWVYVQIVFEPKKDNKGKVEWIEKDRIVPKLGNGAPLSFIPFWMFNIRDLTASTLKPPLLGLANCNVSHFNTSAQLEHALSFCGSPQPYITGYEAQESDTFNIGSSEAWVFPSSDTSVGYLTLGTEGINALQKRLETFEQQMAMLGARMLSPDKKGVEAAETAQIHRQGEVSVVVAACNRVSAGITEILRFMAEWDDQKITITDVLYKISTAFFEQVMNGSEALEIIRIWQTGAIAYSDVLAKFKSGKMVASDRTPEAILSENQTGPITPQMTLLTPTPEVL